MALRSKHNKVKLLSKGKSARTTYCEGMRLGVGKRSSLKGAGKRMRGK